MTDDKPKPLEKSRGEYQKHRVYAPDEIRLALKWAEKEGLRKIKRSFTEHHKIGMLKAIKIYRKAFQAVLDSDLKGGEGMRNGKECWECGQYFYIGIGNERKKVCYRCRMVLALEEQTKIFREFHKGGKK